MRVLHVTLSFARGGRRTAIASLIDGLHDLSVESDLCCLNELGCPAEDVAHLTVDILGRRSLFDRTALHKLRTLLRTRKIDIIHTHDAASQFTAAMARLGIPRLPLLMTFHRTLGIESATAMDRLRNALACSQCGTIVTGSRERREHFLAQNFVPARKVICIPFGTDLARFHPDPESRAAVRKELGFGPGVIAVGTIGHFRDEKGVDVAIRAFQALMGRNPPSSVALVIFGEGPEKPALENLIGLDSRIRFAGFRPDMDRCMRGIDVLLHAPRQEAFGLVIIEAMATGIPVVASRVGGIPELVRDGVTGFLAVPEQPDSFAAALERLLRDPTLLATMGREARRVALEEYSRDLYARRHLQLYERLSGRDARAPR